MTSSNLAAELMRLVNGYRISQAIHVAATLGIADLLRGGPCSAADLSVATNAHPTALYRLLRALAAAGYSMSTTKSGSPLHRWARVSGRTLSGRLRRMQPLSGVPTTGTLGAPFCTASKPATTPIATFTGLGSGIISSGTPRMR